MKKNSAQKIIVSFVIVFVLIVPIKSFALWGVGDETQDPADIATNVNTTVQSTLQTVDQYFGYLKTFGLDGLAYSLAQKASQKIVSSVLNAVNGGASSNKPPNYITNYAQYFQTLSGKTTSNYYSQLSSSSNPFAQQIAVGLANSASGYAKSGLDAFNLNSILTNGTSWQSASHNLSSAGIQGFDFYSALAYPQNTPLGSNLIAQQQLGQNLATAQNIAKIQLTSTGYKPQTLSNTGQGIFSAVGSKFGVNTNSLINGTQNQISQNQQAKSSATEHGGAGEVTYADGSYVLDGVYYDSTSDPIGTVGSDGVIYDNSGTEMGSTQAGSDGLPNGITDYNDTENNGQSIGNPTDASNQDSSTSGSQTTTGADAATGNGTDTTNLTGDQTLNLGSGTSSLSFNTADVGTNALNPNVEDYSGVNDVGANISTPAATTSETVNKSTQEAQSRLQNADSFFKLVFSTLTQLVGGLISKGLSSLHSDAGSTPKYQYGSPASLSGNTNGQGQSWLAGPQTIIDFRNDLDIANQKTALDVQYNQNILNLLKAPVTGKVLNSAQIAAGTPADQGTSDVLEKLEACIPGPDTGWETRLQQYTDAQLNATQKRSNGDSGDATNNARAYKIVEQQVQFAIEEADERINNPLLNMPAASDLGLIAQNFYSNTKKFQGIFTTLLLKRQISSQLSTLVVQAKSLMPSLVLFDDQWQKMTPAQRSSLYTTLSPAITTDFPDDYAITSVDANGNQTTTLKALPASDPTNPNGDPRDIEMEKRVLDEEWHTWETSTSITEDQRQKLYATFASIQNNVTDAGSLQSTKSLMDTVAQQNTDLADALHDCLAIRTATQNYKQYTTQAAWDAFKQTLYSTAVKAGFDPNDSIIALANGTITPDFSKEGDITLSLDKNAGDLPTGDFNDLAAYLVPRVTTIPLPPSNLQPPNTQTIIDDTTGAFSALTGGLTQDNSPQNTLYMRWVDQNNFNQLQVEPVIPLTQDPVKNGQIGTTDVIDALFKEDADGALFCRLPAYTLNYWIPKGLTGQPISCYPVTVGGYSSTHGFSTATAGTNPNWYKVNRAQIYHNFTNTNNF